MEPVLAEHLEWMRLRGLSQATIQRRERVLGWVGAQLGCPLLEATHAQLLAWRAGLRVSADSASVYASHLSQFYRWAVERGLLEGSPAAGLPVPRRGRRLPRPASERDVMAAVASAPPRIRPWLVLAGWAGLRAKEIAYLRREHVLDTARPPVLFIADGATKGRRERVVPMSEFVLAELAPVLPAKGWVFRRRDGHCGPNTPAHVSHLANDHLHGCGIVATLHQLRHRFGTQAYLIRQDIRAVQELLGHQTPASTAGYVAYSDAAAVEIVEAIPAPGQLHAVRDEPAG